MTSHRDKHSLSFAIIAREHIPAIDRLVDRLLHIDGPQQREIVVGIETPGLDTVRERPDERGVRWLDLPAYRGIGYNRNRVLEALTGDIMLGVDDDCLPDSAWLAAMMDALDDPGVSAAVGAIRIPPAGFVGDSISALGFPAGGSAGYETMFRVDPDGTTYNIAAGNWAVRTQVVRELGGFDESLSRGGEDTELAYRMGRANKRIVFVPEAVLEHPARTSIGEFCRWFYVRGRAKQQFARVVPVNGLVGGRLKSYGRILRANVTDPKIVLIAPLLVASVGLQAVGFLAEKIARTPDPMR